MSEPFPDWGPSPRFVSRAATWVMVALACGALGVAVGITLGTPLPGSVAAEPVDALADRPSAVSYSDADIEALAAPVVEAFAYPWEEYLPGWQIEFKPGEDRIAGYTWSREYRIEIFVRSTSTAQTLERVLAHEIGHAVDVSLNDAAERTEWQALRGIDDDPWWPESGEADFETGAGDFAESFAFWVTGDADDFRSRLAGPPDGAELDLLERLIEP